MLEMQGCELTYGKKKIAEISDLVVSPKAKIIVTGNNGSGKTTLLKSIAGLVPIGKGHFQLDVPAEQVTFVHQEPILFLGDVYSNIIYGLKSRGLASEEIARRLADWKPRLGIERLLSQQSHTLSGGEKKRVALVRAMITRPKLLLVDEPLAELDDEMGAELADLLLNLEDTTVLATSPRYDERFEGFSRCEL